MSVLDPREREELSEQELIQRGNIALALLREPVMAEVWDEAGRLLLLKSITEAHVEDREDARRSFMLIESVQMLLEKVVADGQLAARPKH